MSQPKLGKPQVLLFDVNETLLDLAPLKDRINQLLGESDTATLWFTTMLQYSLAMTVSNQYAAFPDIGLATLQMLARSREIVLHEDDAKAALGLMRSLPAHPDVRPALEQLKQAGFRLATLTNSSRSGVQAQMEHAGLSDCFEQQLSVESVGKFKPHIEVYHWAAREMQVDPSECMLVAAHGWDVAGAQWAGLRSTFIMRAKQQIFPLANEPELIVTNLKALAKELSAGSSKYQPIQDSR